VQKFKIPEFILIVMKYASEFVPSEWFDNLPFAYQVHPAISKVFLKSK
jgi:hypothetical protein